MMGVPEGKEKNIKKINKISTPLKNPPTPGKCHWVANNDQRQRHQSAVDSEMQSAAVHKDTHTHKSTHTSCRTTGMRLLKHPCYNRLHEFETMDLFCMFVWVYYMCVRGGGWCKQYPIFWGEKRKKERERQRQIDRESERELEREREENHCGTFDLRAASHNNDLFGPAWLWSPETKAPAFVFFFFFNVCRTKKTKKTKPKHSTLHCKCARTVQRKKPVICLTTAVKQTYTHTQTCFRKHTSSSDLARILTLAQTGTNYGLGTIWGLLSFLIRPHWTWLNFINHMRVIK